MCANRGKSPSAWNAFPEVFNTTADELSKVIDIDDWEVCYYTFMYFDHMWGPHIVDRYATWYNTKLPRFNSLSRVPGSEAVDDFTQGWIYENNWLVPPRKLVAKCINKIKYEGCKSTLFVPMWISASFWPLVCNDGLHFNPFIVDWTDVYMSEQVFLAGITHIMFGGRDLPFRVIALRCSGLQPRCVNTDTNYFCSHARFCILHK